MTCYRWFHTVCYRHFHTICCLQVSKSVSRRKKVSKSKSSTKETDLAGEKMEAGVITIWDSSDEEGGLITAPVKVEEDPEPPAKRTKRTPVHKRTRSARASAGKKKESEKEKSEKEKSEKEESEKEESEKEESEKEESEMEESEMDESE